MTNLFLLRYAIFAILGFIVGWAWREHVLEQQYESQRKRGDYWFDKYQRSIDPSWQFLGEWNDETES